MVKAARLKAFISEIIKECDFTFSSTLDKVKVYIELQSMIYIILPKL